MKVQVSWSQMVYVNKKTPIWRFFIILIPWHDSMRMPRFSNQNTVSTDCAGRAMVASRCNVFYYLCLCILHIGAVNMFDLIICRYRLCILQRYFGSLRRFCPVLWTIKLGMRSHWIWCMWQSVMTVIFFSYHLFPLVWLYYIKSGQKRQQELCYWVVSRYRLIGLVVL